MITRVQGPQTVRFNREEERHSCYCKKSGGGGGVGGLVKLHLAAAIPFNFPSDNEQGSMVMILMKSLHDLCLSFHSLHT